MGLPPSSILCSNSQGVGIASYHYEQNLVSSTTAVTSHSFDPDDTQNISSSEMLS